MLFRPLFSSALALALVVSLPSLHAQSQPPVQKAPASELDAFMERALARREVNKKVVNDYILDERERFEVLGPGRFPLHRTNREYTWFVRDGIHIRSPLKYDGVQVPEEGRVAYEERWLRREKAKASRKAKGEKESKQVSISDAGIHTNVLPTEPGFVSDSYFMDFKFEPGNYYLAGREELAGQEVVKIEYYPTNMFKDNDSEEERKRDRGQQEGDEIARKMNKTALVTLWVDPKTHQIVKYTFDNVWMDFLPGAWLVRVDSMRASMTMFQPFEGVWLPQGIEVSAGITLANGSYEAGYSRSFAEYRQADVKSRIRIPKLPPAPSDTVASTETGTATFSPEGDSSAAAPEMGTATFSQEEDSRAAGLSEAEQNVDVSVAAMETGTATFSGRQEKVAVPEIVREVRVHGNAAVPDAEVLRIAGISVGGALDASGVAAIEKRLKDSGLFSTIEVRKRYRSLTDPGDVALVLIVHEKIAVVVTPAGGIERPILKRVTSRVMFLPIINYADGYGLTYGARFSTVDLVGANERLSVPLTWGATRRVALEAERTFDRGPFTRILGSAALRQHENPGFVLEADDEDSTTDRRVELKARAERNIAGVLFTGIEATRASVDFGPFPTQRQWTVGADAALDTRGNPTFPANAVYLGAGWNALHHRGVDRATNRYVVDARGYLRLIGQPVLAGRVKYLTADGPLPVHERYLVGGSDSLRGFRAGALNGTKFLVTSSELRVPLTSVITGAKLGLTVFADAVKQLDGDDDLNDSRWRRSAGAGLFLIASVVTLNLDVARGLGGHGGTRLHLSSGFAF